MRRDNNQPAPPVAVQTQTYAYCTGNSHGPHKRVAIFNERGLLQWCKQCHCEVLVSWEEIERIRAGFGPAQNGAA